MIMINKNRSIRSNSAMALVEVAIGSMFTTIIVLLVIDAITLIYAFYYNDTACRDAARAASKATPSQTATTISGQTALAYAAAVQAANASLAAHTVNFASNFITPPAITPPGGYNPSASGGGTIGTINYQDFQQGTTIPASPPGMVPYLFKIQKTLARHILTDML